MDEKVVLKKSVHIALIGCIVMGLVSFIAHDMSYILGFLLGYLINVLVFLLIMKMSEGVLKFNMPGIVVGGVFILKLLLYAMGFVLAIKMDLFHLVGVFMGYLVIKLTIYYQGYIYKGGE